MDGWIDQRQSADKCTDRGEDTHCQSMFFTGFDTLSASVDLGHKRTLCCEGIYTTDIKPHRTRIFDVLM
jgi:hypothetical protein